MRRSAILWTVGLLAPVVAGVAYGAVELTSTFTCDPGSGCFGATLFTPAKETPRAVPAPLPTLTQATLSPSRSAADETNEAVSPVSPHGSTETAPAPSSRAAVTLASPTVRIAPSVEPPAPAGSAQATPTDPAPTDSEATSPASDAAASPATAAAAPPARPPAPAEPEPGVLTDPPAGVVLDDNAPAAEQPPPIPYVPVLIFEPARIPPRMR
jgi:hypothetical protein